MTLLLLLAACGPAATDDTAAFAIVGVGPADGNMEAVEAVLPELRFSQPFDPVTCGTDEVRLDGIQEDHTVSFAVPITLASLDGGLKMQFEHERPLPRGWRYAMTVRSGETGCTSVSGETVAPWYSTFFVP